MLAEIRSALRPAFVLLFLLTALTGIAYPLAITGIAQTVFPSQANGSLIVDGGIIVGSELIGQNFADARYFHPRPSAAGNGYDASASAATNLAPGSKDLRDAIAARVADARALGMPEAAVPPDLVTTSASGLDPDLSPEAALFQVGRVARARDMAPQQLRALVLEAIQYPLFGIIGEPHVNVLLLNRQLDRNSATLAQ
ncbi:MAG: potassium-transporting ATPase subunit KdpC [Pseudomonadota bacterium]